ncbi:FAD-binding oxidoreductase [Dethiosulfatarculus sandiegensis]|uniref:FAD-binding protein n=1 Tax=Dethiosulfatarculus sandiegensis TaxID=1429043 RepID=A0A0D2GMY2_9BACT|nr:FAD-linked oxidase C-terminal domain-containing protein [Dethiosulfatarculus sandiegensis]KIX15982.1 FAD-binding protein [Dethiosulfatarculus sandiegensis]
MNRDIKKQLISILGEKACLFAEEDLLTYSYDAGKYRALPQAVALPDKTGQVCEIVKLANKNNLPLVPRGAGTGLTGGAVAAKGGILLSLERMNRILKLDQANRLAVVEPGVINGDLAREAARFGLFYPPDPASVDFSTLGGNIAENAGGMRAVKYGVTKNFVLGLEVVLPTGQIIHTGSKCIKDVVGFSLSELFVGSEGSLGIVTQAILRLLPLPPKQGTLMALFPTMQRAARILPAMARAHVTPSILEFMDHECLKALDAKEDTDLASQAEALLLMEVDGRQEKVASDLASLDRLCRENGASRIEQALKGADRERLWSKRRSLHASLHLIKPRWEEEDISVPVAQLPDMLKSLDQVARDHHLVMANFGHFGDGNIHISFAGHEHDLEKAQALTVRREIYQAAVNLEGRIAAEHGIGLDKTDEISWNLDHSTIEFMAKLKAFLDPNQILNPGKVLPRTEERD